MCCYREYINRLSDTQEFTDPVVDIIFDNDQYCEYCDDNEQVSTEWEIFPTTNDVDEFYDFVGDFRQTYPLFNFFITYRFGSSLTEEFIPNSLLIHHETQLRLRDIIHLIHDRWNGITIFGETLD